MRDPLRRFSVRTKLALLFVGLCMLAYGVGGVLVSREAEQALEGQILSRLEYQCRAWAGALDGSLGTLARRTEDFASDGLIRGHAERLQEEVDPVERERVRAELIDHLTRNKLPLVPAFADLAVTGRDGTVLVDVRGTRLARAEGGGVGPAEAGTRAGALLDGVTSVPDATLPLSTPLRALDGASTVGRLHALVRAEVWVHDAAAAVAGSEDESAVLEGDVELMLRDPTGRSLAVTPRAAPAPGSFSRSYPLDADGWSVEVRLDAGGAWMPVAGLRSRFLGVGLVLAACSLLLLYFPMRFVARPLGLLTRASERLSEGDLQARVAVDSDDEIGDLGRAFNGMAAAIAERTRSLETVAAELRERQAELRAGRDRLQAVIGAMHDGLIVLDAGGRVVIANAAAAPVLDLVERRVPADGHHLCREPNAGAGACFACLFDVQGPPRSCVVDADGRSFEVHTTLLPPAPGARDAGRVLVAREITDRVQRDEQQIHGERLSVLGEVAAVMAHELNNPLASISMFNQMLAAELPEGSPLRENTDVIGRNTETAKRTIRELLDYATGASPEVSEVDVHETLADVARFLRPLAERAGVRLSVEARAGRALVTGDEVQLRQVFVNLALNALQAVAGRIPRPGEGSAAGARNGGGGREREVVLSTSDEGERLVVDVRDSGPGIPPELRETVFRPFFTTKERGEGTGLGLPTAQRIVELHGGSLTLVESSPAGTVFRVRVRAREHAGRSA